MKASIFSDSTQHEDLSTIISLLRGLGERLRAIELLHWLAVDQRRASAVRICPLHGNGKNLHHGAMDT